MIINNINLHDEFLTRMQELLGNEYNDFLKSYEKSSTHGLIVNTNKTTGEKINKLLGGYLRKSQLCDISYVYDEDKTPGKSAFHEMGAYYIQEPSASVSAMELNVTPGDRVLDLCAAPGGKSIQMGIKLQGKGILISNEIMSDRCKILSENIERMGIKNAIVTCEDSSKLADVFPAYFDKIMVDAPCSGEGMFRKNPDACNHWSVENVNMCKKRQLEILDNAMKMLRPGGNLLYSTCTFDYAEDEEVINELLEKYDLTIIKQEKLWPHKIYGEGHFMCHLKDNRESVVIDVPEAIGIDLKKIPEAYSFFKETLNDMSIIEGTIVKHGDNLNLLPNKCPDLKGLKVLRAGLNLGVIKKNRFEPSYSLAKSLQPMDVNKVLDLKAMDERINAYIRGEQIECPELDGEKNGWYLVCAENMPIAFGKLSNTSMKNHYPKGLRKNL